MNWKVTFRVGNLYIQVHVTIIVAAGWRRISGDFVVIRILKIVSEEVCILNEICGSVCTATLVHW